MELRGRFISVWLPWTIAVFGAGGVGYAVGGDANPGLAWAVGIPSFLVLLAVSHAVVGFVSGLLRLRPVDASTLFWRSWTRGSLIVGRGPRPSGPSDRAPLLEARCEVHGMPGLPSGHGRLRAFEDAVEALLDQGRIRWRWEQLKAFHTEDINGLDQPTMLAFEIVPAGGGYTVVVTTDDRPSWIGVLRDRQVEHGRGRA